MDWESLLKDICEALNASDIPSGIGKEEDFERCFVEPIVRKCVASHSAHEQLRIATHPWTKPDTPRPFSDQQREAKKSWAESKSWANATAWGMRRTLDIFVWDATSEDHECIAVEVKFCKTKTGRMPTGEFQRMIGQSTLFLGSKNHKAVIAVFGFRSDASRALSDNGMTEFLRGLEFGPSFYAYPNPR